jgi:hypothetical protein
VGIFSTPNLDTVSVNSTCDMECRLVRQHYKTILSWRHHDHCDWVFLLRNADVVSNYQVTIVALVEPCKPLTSKSYVANVHGSTWNSQQAQSLSYGFCTAKRNRFFKSLHMIADTRPITSWTIMGTTGFWESPLLVSDCFNTWSHIYWNVCRSCVVWLTDFVSES